MNEVLLEHSRNNGENSTKLPRHRKLREFDPAVAVLKKYHDRPAHLARLVTASLGPKMTDVLYRGARVMNPAAFKAGAQLTTSSFTSFTSDEKTAKRFMGAAFHDSGFVAATQPILFIVQGGARKITSHYRVR
ncbi:hypothetical protein KDX38_06185 [Pseudomonas sp. CDFA 602]|uniref:hypothetical protein n=1 Tax=Pseudomonas californiensis TaxID=2829823 RepID=UPI001E2EC50F|nr:hypothetical protein [Pseudomonas californiensis]MCD5993408.1 hypothetical protein [Pseudomonas californiensis]MCD5998801.1 hypothetical protein [Pseudomonas californiensis]